MGVVLSFLHKIHPILPLIYGLIFCVGLIFPVAYIVIRKKTFSIIQIWRDAKGGDVFAKSVISVYFVFLSTSLFGVIVLLFYRGR